jgi:hypothetical protein
VFDPGGVPLGNVEVRAIPSQRGPDVFVQTQRTAPSGEFDLAGIPPGKYFLWAIENSGGAAVVPDVEVGDRDLKDQRITLTRGPAPPGRIVF